VTSTVEFFWELKRAIGMQNRNFVSGVCMVHIIQGIENHYISADLHQVFDTCPPMDEVS